MGMSLGINFIQLLVVILGPSGYKKQSVPVLSKDVHKILDIHSQNVNIHYVATVALFSLLLDAEWISETRDVCLKGITESTTWAWLENIFHLLYTLSTKKFKSLSKYKLIVSETFHTYNLAYLEMQVP